MLMAEMFTVDVKRFQKFVRVTGVHAEVPARAAV